MTLPPRSDQKAETPIQEPQATEKKENSPPKPTAKPRSKKSVPEKQAAKSEPQLLAGKPEPRELALKTEPPKLKLETESQKTEPRKLTPKPEPQKLAAKPKPRKLMPKQKPRTPTLKPEPQQLATKLKPQQLATIAKPQKPAPKPVERPVETVSTKEITKQMSAAAADSSPKWKRPKKSLKKLTEKPQKITLAPKVVSIKSPKSIQPLPQAPPADDKAHFLRQEIPKRNSAVRPQPINTPSSPEQKAATESFNPKVPIDSAGKENPSAGAGWILANRFTVKTRSPNTLGQHAAGVMKAL